MVSTLRHKKVSGFRCQDSIIEEFRNSNDRIPSIPKFLNLQFLISSADT
jgi:hypothetical protein